jgi:mannose-1-phosphate guanylyltransferase/mannose-6-phosphate isomerase
MIVPVILSGGSGTRLWPLSRKQHPKQYLNIHGKKSMLQETILRLNNLPDTKDPIIICNIEHRFIVGEQMKEIGFLNPKIIIEPVARNTAPAIAAVALQVLEDEGKEAIMLVLPADHIINDKDGFHNSIKIAAKNAKSGALVTFGVLPTNANTEYGYIKKLEPINIGSYRVEKFIEKPDKKTAEILFKQDHYFWNSGMFMFKVDDVIKEFNLHAKDILKNILKSVKNASHDFDFIWLEEKSFKSCISKSFDYALMEKSENAVVVPLESDWNDAGSWTALYAIGEKDTEGNVIKGDVIAEDTSDCFIQAEDHVIATIGLKDILIIDTPNATLVSKIDKSHQINMVLNKLESIGRNEQLLHRKVHRPWGWFDSIDNGLNHQVKILCVNINSKLSVQKHFHRSEHWVVIKGKAKVLRDEETLILSKNESTFIKIGVKHSLENIGDENLFVIEVQTGDYFGEDDIIRYEDLYGRS